MTLITALATAAIMMPAGQYEQAAPYPMVRTVPQVAVSQMCALDIGGCVFGPLDANGTSFDAIGYSNGSTIWVVEGLPERLRSQTIEVLK